MHLRRALRYLKLALKALDPRKDPSGRPHGQHAHPAYSEAELLARAEEFNLSAERHWKTMAGEADGRRHALNKPFSNVRDTPAMLYRLGLVLNEMDLGIGMTVLDFGAGSCWVASSINRLRWKPAPGAAGYRVFWRNAWTMDWEHERSVGNVTELLLKDVSIDDYVFGVAALSADGHESVVSAYVNPQRPSVEIKTK